MSRLVLAITSLLLILALPALATSIDRVSGEPVPATLAVPGSFAPVHDDLRDGPLELVTHLADGTSKSVRSLPGNVAPVAERRLPGGLRPDQPDGAGGAGPRAAARPALGHPSWTATWSTWPLRKSAGLLILDYTDPAAPVQVGGLPGFDLLSVCVEGDRAYCGRGTSGVLVVDLTDLAAPAAITTFDTPGSANGTDADGTILYVAMGNDGLGIYDVTDPLAPANLASMATSGFCTYVQEDDGVAYACDGSGLTLFDVALPAAPALLSAVNLGDTCYEMCFTGSTGVIARGRPARPGPGPGDRSRRSRGARRQQREQRLFLRRGGRRPVHGLALHRPARSGRQPGPGGQRSPTAASP